MASWTVVTNSSQAPLTEWPAFPESTYQNRVVKNSSESPPQLILPPGTSHFQEWTSNETLQFVANGMRYYVGAVILSHQRLQPHVLLIHTDESNHLQSSGNQITGSVSSSSPLLLHSTSLPLFLHRQWENPVEVLSSELSKMIQFRPTTAIPGVMELLQSSISHTATVSPPCTDHLDNNNPPNANLTVVTGGRQLAENSIPFSDVKSENQSEIDKASAPFSNEPSATSSSLSFTKEEQLKQVETQSSRVESQRCSPVVTSPLGHWWVVEFGHPPLPFLPPHVTRPKIQIRLYQVVIPPECDIVLPKSNVLSTFVSFDVLLSSNRYNGLGPAYASIPQLVSRFSFRPYVLRNADSTSRNTTNSALFSRLEIGRCGLGQSSNDAALEISDVPMQYRASSEDQASNQQEILQNIQHELKEDASEHIQPSSEE